MELTEEETQLILEKRKQEEAELPIKSGILKHDLYVVKDMEFYCDCKWVLNQQERDKLIKDFEENVPMEIHAGEELMCYLVNGEEQWCDDSGYIADYSAKWAEENLIDIKELRKIKG